MARLDSTQKSINRIEEFGRENKNLIPQVKDWCIHINVDGYAQGMFAQAAGLPNYVSLTCQHASFPQDWMRLSVIAEQFIEANCLNCSFHKFRKEPNYGKVVLLKLKKRDDEKLENDRLKKELAEKVIQETNTLIATGKENANPTQLSILRMVAKLTDENERKTIAERLLAASQLDPKFFSDAALDVLLIFFEDKNAGAECIDAACYVMVGRIYFPPKAFALAKAQIATSPHFNNLAKILSFYIDKNNFSENTVTIDALLDRLWYKRNVGEPAVPIRNFQNCERLLITLGQTAPEYLTEVFRKRLAVNKKTQRVNINLLFQNLAADLPELIATLTPEIIHSLELEDDEYEQSADLITLHTLNSIIKLFPSRTLEFLRTEKLKLSIHVQAILPRLIIELLSDREFSDHHTQITEELVDELVAAILNKNVPDEIREASTHELSYFIRERPELFQSRFDGFLGGLSKIAEDDATFKYFRNELENKQPKEHATFNYLVGKTFWEIEEIEQNIHKRYEEIKRIIGGLCEAAPQQNLPKVYSLIPNIDSVKNQAYKQELISIIRSYGKDPVTMSGFIPQLYQHLLDPNSMSIRHTALKFMDVLLDRFPSLITSSLWDLFEIFIKDKEPVVKGMALTILGTVARKYPQKVTVEHITIHKEGLYNTKVFVHTSAIKIARNLYQFMDSAQRYDVTCLLIKLAEVYENDKDEDVFSSILDQLLYFVSEQPKAIYKISNRFIIPKIKTEDYYITLQYITKLKDLAEKTPEVSPLWLSSALSFLIRFPYDGGSQDKRLDFYYDMHHLQRKVIIDEEAQFRTLLSLQRNSMQTHFDVAHTLNVLGYFECYDLIKEMTGVLKLQYPDVESNKYILRNIHFWSFLTASEIASDKVEKIDNLKAAKNVF